MALQPNQVYYGDQKVMDISDSTVAPETLGEGETAYDKSGKKITGTMQRGVQLPELTNPASASDIADGMEAIGADGAKIIGNISKVESTYSVDFEFYSLEDLTTEKCISLRGTGSNPVIVYPGGRVGVKAPHTLFGDATVSDVLKGKRFTSADGYKVVGTYEPPTGGATVLTAESTPTANSLTLEFTGLSGEPTLFSVHPKENITLGSTRYILGVDYDGENTVGIQGYSSGSFMSSSATATYSETAFSWTYANGTLTVTSGSATTGGYFMSGITYQLVYITDTLTQGEVVGPSLDLSQVTVTEASMLDGVKAYDKTGKLIEGSIQSQAAQTITPKTTDQTIAAGKYLSGIQTIKGDSNLIAGNIKKGVSIFGVAGSLEESSGAQLPDGAIAVQIVKAAEASTQVGSGYSLSITYGDAVEISDSIALAFSGTTKTLSNISDTTDFSVLLGKYIRSGSTTTAKYYYIPNDATFTVGGSTYSKTLTCDKAQAVSMQKVST